MPTIKTKAEKARTIVARMDADGAEPKAIVARIAKVAELNEPAARTYMYNARRAIAAEAKANKPKRQKKAA